MIASSSPFRMIDLADLAASSRTQYRYARQPFLRETGAAITDVEALTECASGLLRSSRAFLKAAVALVAGTSAGQEGAEE